MENIKQYGIYILIAIAFSAIGAVLTHHYSSKVISSLQEEIDSDKRVSIDEIKKHLVELDTLNKYIDASKKENDKLYKKILNEKNRRTYILKPDSTIFFVNDNDSILEYLRNKLK